MLNKSASIIDATICIIDGDRPRAILTGRANKDEEDLYEFGQINLSNISSEFNFSTIQFDGVDINLFQAHRALQQEVRSFGYAQDILIALANFVKQDNGYIALFPIGYSTSSKDAIHSYKSLLKSSNFKSSSVICSVDNKTRTLDIFEYSIGELPIDLLNHSCRLDDVRNTIPKNALYKVQHSTHVSAGILLRGGISSPSIPVRIIDESEAEQIGGNSRKPNWFRENKNFEKFKDRLDQIEKIRTGQ